MLCLDLYYMLEVLESYGTRALYEFIEGFKNFLTMDMFL